MELSFGAGMFQGDARWLEIGVRPGTSTGTFTVLSPRQPVSPTPYAFYAKVAGTANALKLPFAGTSDAAVSLDIASTAPTGTAAKLKANTALELDGALMVSGANRAAFVSAAVTGDTNTCDVTGVETGLVLDNPQINGDPNAILIVTPRGGLSMAAAVGVLYDSDGATTPPNCGTGRWVIYRLDHATALLSLTLGMTFNVLVIKVPAP